MPTLNNPPDHGAEPWLAPHGSGSGIGGRHLNQWPGRARSWDRVVNLPYGLWRCHDGREIVFNRLYQPLIVKTPTGEFQPADRGDLVRYVAQFWFYDDGHVEREKRERATSMLRRAGWSGFENALARAALPRPKWDSRCRCWRYAPACAENGGAAP